MEGEYAYTNAFSQSSTMKYEPALSPGMLVARPNIWTRPICSYTSLIACAIYESPKQMLCLSDIYTWIVKNYPYFQTAGNGWKVRRPTLGSVATLTHASY